MQVQNESHAAAGGPWRDTLNSARDPHCTGAQGLLGTVLNKAKFWKKASTHALNDRQITVLNRLLDGF